MLGIPADSHSMKLVKRVASLGRPTSTSVFALLMCASFPAAAQMSAAAALKEAAPASPAVAASGTDQLSDIIVTARRVQERLQDIPASVSAVTGEQVATMNSLADIQALVSGVTFKTFGPIPTVGIRGFGNRTQAGNAVNSTVGIFQDGVFIAPPLVALSSRIDTGRIEVAKGPQSTLYGRSSFTGAINIVSNDPAKEFSGYLDAGYGGSSVHSEQLWHVQGAVSVPLTDALSVRFFGLREKRDGYVYDSLTGNRGGGYNRTIGRVKVLWEPSDSFTARLTGTLIDDNLPLGLTHSGRNSPPLGQNNLFGDPLNPAVRTALQFGPTVWDAIYVNPQSAKTTGQEVTLDLRIKTPVGELASLTDYQHSHQDILTGLDLTRLAYARGDTLFDERRVSQEFRLTNKIGRVTYLAGLYYLHVEARQGGGEALDPNHAFANFGPGSAFFDGLVIPHVPINALFQPIYTKTDAYAAFGQIGFDITDALNLTVGLRQSRDELSGPTGSFLRTAAGGLIPAQPTTQRRGNFDATTGTANLSYKIAPDVIAYGSYSRGNSPGGLNVGGAALINYRPQSVDAFELGIKSQLLNRHLQLNAALFDNEYKNLQITQNVFINSALTPLVTNAGNARGRGIDIDALAVLSSNFRLGVQYTYAESKITRYNLPAAPAPQVDFTGVALVRSPKNTANGTITFTAPVGAGKFLLTAEESYTSSYNNDYQGVPAGTAYPGIPGVIAPGVTTAQVLALYRTPGYAVTNLNASYTWKNWQVSGFVRNLFNHQYIAGILAFDTVTYPQELPGEPRTFEGSVKFSF
ncbi:TonB-dependent receptor (plasmid) [Polymorphobacter sp. PAMC 29334]|uniref:TonB-dependent receptor n=1 Tax=Polymorphobacter sp. PAMC 29334 TaxID=2862331 RepID=UPI001C74790D|nr:TonB-dependent receptor [Polymorphobacter sp. PAMC 29334]QYE37113.1 TonB-dependent receptor [Polymorphobacter sp. PAMC 29334]